MKNGQILLFALIFLAVVAILTATLFTRTANFASFGSKAIAKEQANSLAEAGIDKALWQLNQTAGSYTGETNSSLTLGTFSTSVQTKSANLKTITATGYIPNALTPRVKRTITTDVSVNTQIISFNFAVQVGTGGVNMSNSSSVNGNVYSNGNITGSGSSQIDGDAFAVGTISSPDPTVLGTKRPNEPPTELPVLDYQMWKDAAEAGGTTTCSPTCTINASTSIGPRKYQGNLTITNNAVVTINGPIWVTGNLFVTQGGTQMNLNNNFGSSGTVILADGTISVTQGGSFNPTNATPKGYIIVVSTSTSSSAISIGNSGANAFFYALEGGASLSQAAQVSNIVAKSLDLQNSASLTYDTGLASTEFSTGPGGTWQPVKGTYKYSN